MLWWLKCGSAILKASHLPNVDTAFWLNISLSVCSQIPLHFCNPNFYYKMLGSYPKQELLHWELLLILQVRELRLREVSQACSRPVRACSHLGLHPKLFQPHHSSTKKARDKFKLHSGAVSDVKNLLRVKHKAMICSVQSLSRVRPFATPWTIALQASLSITNPRSPPSPMSIEPVMPSNVRKSKLYHFSSKWQNAMVKAGRGWTEEEPQPAGARGRKYSEWGDCARLLKPPVGQWIWINRFQDIGAALCHLALGKLRWVPNSQGKLPFFQWSCTDVRAGT